MNIRICSLNKYDSVLDFCKDLELSRSQIKRYLSLKQRSKSISQKEEIELSINLLNNCKIYPQHKGSDCVILKESEKLLAIHKPPKLNSHPLKYTDAQNTLSFLRENNKQEYLEINTSSYDRGLLFRLDFETSGLLLLTKDQNLYQDVRRRFHQIFEGKYYLCLVKGKVDDQVIQRNLDVSSKKVKIDPQGLESKIEVSNLYFSKELDLSFLKVRLFEGRRHQIRVLLKSIGHPILGDPLYGAENAETRMYLHCYQVKIKLDNRQGFLSTEIHDFSQRLNLSLEKVLDLLNRDSLT